MDPLAIGGDWGRREFMKFAAAATTAGLVLAESSSAGLAQTEQTKYTSNALKVERHGSLLVMEIHRPPENRLDADVIFGLGKAYHLLESDDDLRAGVLRASGPNFSFGVDVESLLRAQAAGLFKDPEFITPLALRPPYRTKPAVVAVQGAVRYGGHELFLACDIRVGASDAKFNQGEVTRGVFPGGGATVRLPREIGWGNAMYLMLTGRDWSAEEAYRMGLLQEIVPPGRQHDRASELARAVAAAAPLGIRATMSSSRQALSSEEAALSAVPAAFARVAASQDREEGVRAAQEGRSPLFKGR